MSPGLKKIGSMQNSTGKGSGRYAVSSNTTNSSSLAHVHWRAVFPTTASTSESTY